MKTYLIAGFVIAFFACLLVYASLDKKKTNIRRLVLIAVMTGLCIISRFLFAPVPGFKPMTAIIILTAIYLGKEAGFMCGAFTALISNIYFGQGPWTPFQMMAFGLIGFCAGVFSGALKKNRVVLLLYGLLGGIAYSFIMDIWTVLWYDNGFSTDLYKAALITAIPYTIAYCISNVVFILIFDKSLRKKLGRIIIKYNI